MIFLTLFLEFFKIGLFTFGGGYAMIPLVKEVVLKYGWLLESEFYDFLGVCESTPGPIAVNMATYIGSTQGGILGSLLATLGVVLPSFIIILLVATILKKLIKNTYFQSFLNGVKPIVVGLILSTGLMLIVKCFGFNSITQFNFDLVSVVTFALLSIGYCLIKYVFKKKINNVYFILVSAVVGILSSGIFLGF